MTPAPDDLVARLRAAGCVFAEEEAALLATEADSPERLEELVACRVAGHPLEHVLGWVEFGALRVRLEPHVFVPRRRTLLMVREAAARARTAGPRPTVVDLCCGSGAVGLAVLEELGEAELHAADIDEDAVRCAARNLAGRGRVHRGDLFAALPSTLRGRVDVLTANVPYVPTDEIALMPPEARDHEARTALDGGVDGLAVMRRMVAQAKGWVVAGGCVLVEVAERQVAPATALMERCGLRSEAVSDEQLGSTVLVATMPR